MSHTGPADPLESDRPLPTRREARALRDAAEARDTAASTGAAPVAELTVPTPVMPVVTTDLAARVSYPRRTRPTPAPAAARPAPRRRRGTSTPVAKVITLLAIPAIFLTTALPAYAFSPNGDGASVVARPAAEVQGVTVGAAAASVNISFDQFSSTSQAELDEIEAAIQADLTQKAEAEAARASAASFSVVGLRAEGDDYPWPSAATDDQGGGLSPLGYYYRECVDFVAWRLNRDAGSTGGPWKWNWSSMTPNGGNASAWQGNWAAKGWPTSKAPVVGAVAWFTYNHVAYVQSIPGDGTVVLEEYNWMGSHAYHTRTVPISEVPVYLYPPA